MISTRLIFFTKFHHPLSVSSQFHVYSFNLFLYVYLISSNSSSLLLFFFLSFTSVVYLFFISILVSLCSLSSSVFLFSFLVSSSVSFLFPLFFLAFSFLQYLVLFYSLILYASFPLPTHPFILHSFESPHIFSFITSSIFTASPASVSSLVSPSPVSSLVSTRFFSFNTPGIFIVSSASVSSLVSPYSFLLQFHLVSSLVLPRFFLFHQVSFLHSFSTFQYLHNITIISFFLVSPSLLCFTSFLLQFHIFRFSEFQHPQYLHSITSLSLFIYITISVSSVSPRFFLSFIISRFFSFNTLIYSQYRHPPFLQ